MKLPTFRDFLHNSYHLQRNFPRAAALRENFHKEYLGMIPLFYLVIYPPFLLLFWIFSSPFSKLLVNLFHGTLLSFDRYDSFVTASALSEAVKADLMSLVLLPVSIPKAAFTSLAGTSVGEALAALLSFLFLLLFIGGIVLFATKIVYGSFKFVCRFFMT